MAKILVAICVGVIFALSCDACPDIKTRHNWGGRPSKSIDYQPVPVPNVIIHHTASSPCNSFLTCSVKVANIQDYHMNDLKWSDIGYNFLIGNDGNVYEGVGWNKVGAHARGYNDKSIGVAFIGNFDGVLPPTAALDAAKSLLRCGVEDGLLAKNYRLFGARQVKKTISPGLMLYNEIQNWDNWVAAP
ncbi:unnamed protein product [Hermetia illucens]|uniref:Peptidoglycan-recognition protein n=1 Tax=Hermetia illucens TaxID=343691 RepID=A0A7R8Z1Y2_HERIL|nr:peptidoglycan-recognition protein 2-like [Hermetia illucens]CAD7090196.1 unnamed protein product [Hermetia illucens]